MADAETETRELSIPASDGEMASYLALPKGSEPTVAVLVLVELWGLNAHMRDVCNRIADAGHAALAVDLFRGAIPPVPEDPVEKWAATFDEFDDRRCVRDCRHAVNWLLDGNTGGEIDSVFPWGFCMGGRFAHHLGAFSDRVAGVINFYGRLDFPRMANKPFTPLDVAGVIDTPYLGCFAETDGLIPHDDVEALRVALQHNDDADIRIFKGTEHAFFNDVRPAYDRRAAAQAWDLVNGFIARHG